MFSLTAVKAFVTLALMTASWVEVVTSLEHVVSLTGDDTENPDFASRCVDSDLQEGRPVVEIDFDNARSFPQYEELDMEGLFKPLGDFQIIREPSQVKLIMPFDKDQSDQTPIMSGGELFGSYKLREVRIVWGRKNTLSSRHILAGERFPLEMHMIHQKVPLNKYSIRDIHQPMTDLAVIAVLFEESPKTSATFSNLVNIILGGKNESGGMQVTLGKMFPQDVDVFFRYEELMMDPSCQAHVSWTVFPTPARLPVKEFRRLQTLYKPGDGTESSKSIVDKEYVLNVDVRLMSPRQSAEMIPGLMAPPDLHHRPAYALIPPPQHDPYSDALDHRGINVYHVYQESLHHGDDQESPLEAVKISPKGEPEPLHSRNDKFAGMPELTGSKDSFFAVSPSEVNLKKSAENNQKIAESDGKGEKIPQSRDEDHHGISGEDPEGSGSSAGNNNNRHAKTSALTSNSNSLSFPGVALLIICFAKLLSSLAF